MEIPVAILYKKCIWFQDSTYVVVASRDARKMFKSNSGRKPQSTVWQYFDYEPSVDKSSCKLENCSTQLKTKNATDLMNHI